MCDGGVSRGGDGGSDGNGAWPEAADAVAAGGFSLAPFTAAELKQLRRELSGKARKAAAHRVADSRDAHGLDDAARAQLRGDG